MLFTFAYLHHGDFIVLRNGLIGIYDQYNEKFIMEFGTPLERMKFRSDGTGKNKLTEDIMKVLRPVEDRFGYITFQNCTHPRMCTEIFKRKPSFYAWVDETISAFRHDRSARLLPTDEKKLTIIASTNSSAVGCARCNPDDGYDKDIGIAIAYARMKGLEIPKMNGGK